MANERLTLNLSDAMMVLIRSIAAHERLTLEGTIRQAIADKARAIGLGALARAVCDADGEGGE